MRIIDERKNKETVTFMSISVGDIFEHDGNIYIKTTEAYPNELYNAILLNECPSERTLFDSFEKIKPLNVELHIIEEE